MNTEDPIKTFSFLGEIVRVIPVPIGTKKLEFYPHLYFARVTVPIVSHDIEGQDRLA